ncbi:MAG: hypothetical protein K0Q62_14 [Phenylobacterium sp.]|jgi:hypothetical protein|nr:hypothetical protein [Phenylobacterium sp.]
MSRPAKWFIETLSPADAALLPPNLRLGTLAHVDLTAKQATPLARAYGLKATPSFIAVMRDGRSRVRVQGTREV